MNKTKNIVPKTILGKWSVGVNAVFIVIMAVSITLVKGLGILNFDDTWWDITVGITFPAGIIAFVFGLIAFIKNKDRSVLLYLSVLFGVCLILFILLHSLFIND